MPDPDNNEPSPASQAKYNSSIGQTFAPVFATETDRILARRKACNTTASDDDPLDLPDIPSRPEQGYSPFCQTFIDTYDALRDNDDAWQSATDNEPVEQGLVGLALSGGGIRSSTFNLGVLQAIQNVGLFPFIDYLSTVSGGGYIGTYLTTSIQEEAREKESQQVPDTDDPADHFPLKHIVGEVENWRIRHLRNYSNFLAPNGNAELLSAPLLLLRGIVVNGLFLVPLFVFIAWLISLIVTKNEIENTFSLAYPFAIHTWFEGIPLLGAVPLTTAAFSFLLATFIVYPIAYRVTEALSNSPMRRRRRRAAYLKLLRYFVGFIAILAIVETIPHTLNLMQSSVNVWLTAGLSGLIATVPFADKIANGFSALVAKFGATFYGALGILVIWFLVLFTVWHFKGSASQEWWLLASGASLLLALLTVDVNSTSIHRYYRDHLVKAFVAQAADDDTPEEDRKGEDPVPKLSHLVDGVSTQAPYPLINTAINVATADVKYRSGRMASFFSFSPDFCGGIRSGYVHTADLEGMTPDLDIGAAMAISGAAASPNMGKYTNRLMAFILALLNVRLNYWLPNPGHITEQAHGPLYELRKRFDRVGPLYLLFEMLGHLNTKHRFVNLSDGGHIENLGVYELLRRQCRLILAGDGECDPSLSFEGLTEVIRLARIDFGFHIEMEGLDELRSGDQQYAIGTIYYGKEEVDGQLEDRYGKLIYIKSNLGGDYNLESTLDTEFYRTSADRDDDRRFDENSYMSHYKTLKPDFPQESTADQFFDEAQFENYRALGFQVAASVLRAPRHNMTQTQGDL